MVPSIERFVSRNWGALTGDALSLAAIAYIFAIVFGFVG